MTRKRDLAAMLAIIVVGGVCTIVLGERIGVHGGQGWDGITYSAWAREFPTTMFDIGITTFQAERVLPSAIVYYALTAFDIQRSTANVICAFQILDLAALVLTALALWRIAILLAWTRTQAWVAFVATFLGFATAREALYYPTMTDPTAFALGMGTVWAFVARRPIAQWVLAFASTFTWPALAPVGYLALVLPRPTTPIPTTTRWQPWLACGVALVTAALIIAAFVDVLLEPLGIDRWLSRAPTKLYPLTIALVAIPSALATYSIARQRETWSLWPYLRHVGWTRISGGIAGVAVILVARHLWVNLAGTRGYGFGLEELQQYYVASAVLGPLWNVVHHVTYFGPIVLVAYGAWPACAAVVARWGPAAVLVLVLAVATSVTSDARHLLHLIPFLVVVVVTATADWWSPRRALVFAALYVPWSKVWLKIGYTKVHDSLAWPDQRFFMHNGPWATPETFAAHLAAMTLTAAALWALLRRGRAA